MGSAAPDAGMITIARAALDLLNHRMSGRDATVADLFVEEALLIGSETGEEARGRSEIAALLGGIQARGLAVRWDLPELDCGGAGELCWLYGDGHAVITSAEGTRRVPYRVSGILQCAEGEWRWRLFHGSEPAD